MIKGLIYTLLFVLLGTPTFSQTTATDFVAEDCDGTMHHLFADLDAGKVVIIVWTMPCGACIGPSLTAFTAVGNFVNDYPDKVIFYLVDDFADTPCSTLQAWAGANGLPKSGVFSNHIIDMYDYGQYGMPKVVVLGGGSEHKVYYNANYSVQVQVLNAAIIEALAASTTSVSESLELDLGLALFPNPASNEVHISFQLPNSSELSADLINMLGTTTELYAWEGKQPAGVQELQIDISELSNGVYFLRLNTEDGFQTARFHVSR